MTSKFVLALLLAISSTLAVAGTVNLLPSHPQAGEDLTIEYRPSESETVWAQKSMALHAVALWFGAESQSPIATDVPLTFDGKRFTGKYSIPATAVYIMFKVGNGVDYDNNKEDYWATLVYDANGRAVSCANLRASQTYLGQLPPECKRKQDIDEARELLNQETKISPKLLTPRINLVMLDASLGTYSREEGLVRLKQLASPTTVPSNGEEAMAVAAAFRAIGDSAEADRIFREWSMKFPRSILTEQIRLERLSKAGTIDDFVNMVTEYLQEYPRSNARPSLIESVLNATTKQAAFPALIRFLETVPNLPAVVYYQAVNYLGMQDSLRTKTTQLIESGLAAASNPEARLEYVGQSEWAAQQELSRSQIYFVKGAILRSEGQLALATDAFKKSVEHGGAMTDKGVYEMLISTLDAKTQTPDVIKYCEKAISSGAYTTAIIESYKVALAQQGKSASEINDAVEQHKKSGTQAFVARIAAEKLNMPMIDGQFSTLDNVPIKISDWKGKVVLIDYWATWCGPCRKSFPALQKLYEKYKANPNVVFAIVNVWERSDDRSKTVRDFLTSNPTLSLPMYLDKTDAVVGKYGVTGIPTKFILGKDGRIQFKEVGLAPDDQFIEEFSQKIDLLLAE